MRQIGITRPMDNSHSYTLVELLALREKLKLALGEREAVLGRAEIKTIGSVSKGAEKPNDIDLRVRIEKLLSDPAVQAAAEVAICVVIRANCFDGQNARILKKSNIWQWPLDVVISDGTKCLCLKALSHKSDEIKFTLLPLLSTQTKDFPEMGSSVPEPRSSSPETSPESAHTKTPQRENT
jgi:hypothetical protein